MFLTMTSSRRSSVLLLAVSLLGACAPLEPTPTPAIQPSSPPPTVTPRLPTSTPEPTAPLHCTETAGTVEQRLVSVPGDERPLVYWLYLPPCFDHYHPSPYPTLYLLHGLAQSDSEWLDLGLPERADALIVGKAVPAFIVVMPGERTGFDMQAILIDILLPEIERSFPAGGSRELRAIGGISRGGGWALRIGLQRPDLFCAIGLHSPAVISPDLYWLPIWAAEVPPDAIPRLWVDLGTEDTLLRPALELREQLDKIRWPYTWTVSRGEHTSTYWSGHLDDYLRWYAETWPSASSTAN